MTEMMNYPGASSSTGGMAQQQPAAAAASAAAAVDSLLESALAELEGSLPKDNEFGSGPKLFLFVIDRQKEDIRAPYRAAYLTEVADRSERADALVRTIQVMEPRNFGVPGKALLQLPEIVRMTPKAQKFIASLIITLWQGNTGELDFNDYVALELKACEIQSDGIFGVQQRLRDEYRTKRGECGKNGR